MVIRDIERVEVLKPEQYIVEKIVVVTNVEQEAVEVRVEKGRPYHVDNLVIVDKPVVVEVVREIPKVVNVEKIVELRTVHEVLREVQIEGKERIVTVESVRPDIVQVTQ